MFISGPAGEEGGNKISSQRNLLDGKPELYLDFGENLLNREKVSKLKTVPVLEYQSCSWKNVNGPLRTFSHRED